MSRGAHINLRDLLGRAKAGIALPSWLSDNYPASPSYGYRFLWVLALFADAAIEAVLSGSEAAVGRNPTGLPYVGQARGVIRNQDESVQDYEERLRTWIDLARELGSAYRLATAIHDYLRSKPRVRVFRRDGYCITVDHDRTITVDAETAWDWDSVSHPERSGFWSDLFVVVYTRPAPGDPIEQWAHRPGAFGALTGDDGFAIGHMASKAEIDALKGLILLCKSAHSCVRAVIWTSDTTRFVPTDDASMPDGTWGAWSMNVAGSQVLSGRDLTTCRYWEPR